MEASRVALIGFMAAGKSTVGRLLAARLGWSFADLDAVVEERAGMTVAELFHRRGEAAFRRMEAGCLAGLASRERLVLAAGGGAPLEEANLPFFRDPATAVFFLHANLEDVRARASDDGSRPLLAWGDDETQRLYERRLPRYRALGREIVTSGRTPEEIATEIAGLLGA